MLRTIEAFEVTKSCIALGAVNSVVQLPFTKRGLRDFVSIDDPLVINLLRARLPDLQPGDRLAELPNHKLRIFFTRALNELDASEHGFRLYSFRRGGATHFFRTRGSMDQACERGRWTSSRTARLYITDGAARLAELSLSTRCRSTCYALADLMTRALDNTEMVRQTPTQSTSSRSTPSTLVAAVRPRRRAVPASSPPVGADAGGRPVLPLRPVGP